MRPSTTQNLVSLFRSAAGLASRRSAAAKKKKPSSASASPGAAKKCPTSSSPLADDADLKKHLSSITFSSSSSSGSVNLHLKQYKAPLSSKISNSTSTTLHSIVSDSLNADGRRGDDDKSAELLSDDASSLLHDEMDLDWENDHEGKQTFGLADSLSMLAKMTNDNILLQRKNVTGVRNHRWVYKNTHCSRFTKLVNMCGTMLGSEATIEIFGRLGTKTGLNEYNALIRICMEKARSTNDEDVSLEQIYKAYQIFKLVTERGFKIKEEMYGQLLMYLVDYGMVEEFFFFHEIIRDKSPDSLPRLAYYEMLLWMRVKNEEKIQELLGSVMASEAEEKSLFQESLLMALCEGGRREDFLMLLDTIDITKVSPVASIQRVFRALGEHLLEPHAERFLLVLKRSDIGAENISNFIHEYAVSLPNLAVEDIIIKFRKLHTKFEVLPTSTQYEKLVRYCSEFFKVHEALCVVDEACGSGVGISLESFHSILDACYKRCEFNLVHQIKSRISQQNLKPNDETIRKMILLYVKMKDFEGAYGLINDLPNMGINPTAGMYNTIMAEYFREKKVQSAINVLKEMEGADVKPDALTYSYLINNCHSEKDIIKIFEDMSNSGVKPTKCVFMALINAYAACGQFENAKKVILNAKIPVKDLNEVKAALVEALAENGQLSDAIMIYEEIKKAECDLSPKSIRCLIEHFQSEGELNKSLQLLKEVNGSPYWHDACFTVISHCVRYENLRCTIDLLKQLQYKYMNADVAQEVLFDEVFCILAEKESKDMQFGLDLLQALKEELGVHPSRKCLDFLLTACVSAKDSKASFVIWKEYKAAGLPYNVLSYVRMYQALLASGDRKSAAKVLNKIKQDDPHVRIVLRACRNTYIKPPSVQKRQKKKKKALVATMGLMDALGAKTK
ncbi:Pentatricopeptide repeat-containing protein -mitochondrial [Striga hermonthica]|uniref:Pentatricopeptide repeat-containing protein -mitochondrial n=1 Tax=Striga hermonthica TaxID=68872 RepID=A0A9N7R6J3_STRHE|nr:Pentatricopeptide repeat-containing protein -mitochondrial [Striga hermonthica]